MKDTAPKLSPFTYFLLALVISILLGGFQTVPREPHVEYTLVTAFVIGVASAAMHSVLFAGAVWILPLFLFNFFCLCLGNLVGLTIIDLINGYSVLSTLLAAFVGAGLTFLSYLGFVQILKRKQHSS